MTPEQHAGFVSTAADLLRIVANDDLRECAVCALPATNLDDASQEGDCPVHGRVEVWHSGNAVNAAEAFRTLTGHEWWQAS
jgi:uncharacterized protein (UPF0147 family)